MFRMLAESNELHDRLVANVEHFREGMMAAGFDIKPTQSAICAVMLYDAKLSQDFAARLQDEGRIRHGILLSRRAERPGPHPRTVVRRPRNGTSG
mgnify:CR=1 FL=1